MWERSFVATSVLLGASVDEALSALAPDAAPRIEDLVAQLRDTRRATRAHALAAATQAIVVALDEVTLA